MSNHLFEGITTIQVLRDLGIELDKRTTWAVGVAVQARFVKLFGRSPPKDLRQKTNDPGGVHCFAIYPYSFREEIEAIARRFGSRVSRQLKLF